MTAAESAPSATIAARSITSPPEKCGRAKRVTNARISSSSIVPILVFLRVDELREPRQHVRGVPLRRKDGIKHLFNLSSAGNKRQSLVQQHSVSLESRKAQPRVQLHLAIAQQRIRDVLPFCKLGLIRRRLRTYTDDRCSQLDELVHVVAESTALRGAAARPRNLIPTVRQGLAGASSSWVHIHDQSTRRRSRTKVVKATLRGHQ